MSLFLCLRALISVLLLVLRSRVLAAAEVIRAARPVFRFATAVYVFVCLSVCPSVSVCPWSDDVTHGACVLFLLLRNRQTLAHRRHSTHSHTRKCVCRSAHGRSVRRRGQRQCEKRGGNGGENARTRGYSCQLCRFLFWLAFVAVSVSVYSVPVCLDVFGASVCVRLSLSFSCYALAESPH